MDHNSNMCLIFDTYVLFFANCRYSYSRPNEISRPAPPYDQKPQDFLRPQPPPTYESSNEIVRQQQHYETHEPEQPADIPIIVGQFIREQVSFYNSVFFPREIAEQKIN